MGAENVVGGHGAGGGVEAEFAVAVGRARGRVVEVGRQLAEARAVMAERDPVAAARAALGAAVSALRASDADVEAAGRLASAAATALEEALEQAMAGPRERMLAGLSEMSAYLGAGVSMERSGRGARGSTRRSGGTTLPAGGAGEGQSDAVRAYFEAVRGR